MASDQVVVCQLKTTTINNQSINQSINQTINQSISQSYSQSIIQSINQSVNHTVNQSINQSQTYFNFELDDRKIANIFTGVPSLRGVTQ